MVPKRVAQLVGISRKDCISGQAAGVQKGVCKISNELMRIMALEFQRRRDRGLNAVCARHLEKHNRMAMQLPFGFKFKVRRKLYAEPLTQKRSMEGQNRSSVVSG